MTTTSYHWMLLVTLLLIFGRVPGLLIDYLSSLVLRIIRDDIEDISSPARQRSLFIFFFLLPLFLLFILFYFFVFFFFAFDLARAIFLRVCALN